MRRHWLFILSLVAPILALVSFSIIQKAWSPTVYFVTAGAVAFVLTFVDKKRAQADRFRISEKVLHLTELLGGWPLAYIAQQTFRHKTQKRSYRLVFWLIVAIYQFVAAEIIYRIFFDGSFLLFIDRL